jgi:hypothetical protein
MSATAAEETIKNLRTRLAQLSEENAVLLSLVGGTTPTTTQPVPTVIVQGVKVKASLFEVGILAGVSCVAIVLWALPMMKPFKRCCESKIYKIFPLITVFNFILLGATLNALNFLAFNDLFFMSVQALEIVINSTQQVIMAFAATIVLVLLWKFKDRILETLGVDNPQMVVGEFRDWATLWSMKRFYPIEVFIWKVEGLPGMHLHQMNDVFVEASCGYNNVMRTRVHLRAGHGCIFKESMQMNFDHFDKENMVNITIKNQDVVGSSDIASIQLGSQQVHRLMEPNALETSERTIGWGTTSGTTDGVWNKDRFKPIDLIPAGQIFLRFQAVTDKEKVIGPSYGKVGTTC